MVLVTQPSILPSKTTLDYYEVFLLDYNRIKSGNILGYTENYTRQIRHIQTDFHLIQNPDTFYFVNQSRTDSSANLLLGVKALLCSPRYSM